MNVNKKKMAESRFAISSKDGIQNLKETTSNDNTRKSTQTWINVWRSWAEERGINPSLEENSAEVLDSILQQFHAEVRNKRGESHEPESLKVMMASLDRYLRERNYPHSIIKDRQFQQSKKVLEGQAKLLRQEGKGKRPNASSALSIAEEEALWENGKLGSSSPRVLCYTVWWILTQHFGLWGRQEHHSMNVEDFNLCRDDRGIEYITFKENPTKTRQGGLNSKRRQVLPKMFAAGCPRCPVGLFKDFLSRRPPELRESGPFYLAVIERPKREACCLRSKGSVSTALIR